MWDPLFIVFVSQPSYKELNAIWDITPFYLSQQLCEVEINRSIKDWQDVAALGALAGQKGGIQMLLTLL